MDKRRQRWRSVRWVRRLGLLVIAVAIGVMVGRDIHATEPPIPVDVHLKLLLKALNYNRAFAPKTAEGARVGILFQPGFRISVDVSGEAESYLQSTDSLNVSGFKVLVQLIPYNSLAQLDSVLASDSIDILYLAPLRSVDITKILAATRERHIVTITGVPQFVSEGVTVGIGIRGGKAELLINQLSALAEGAQFSAQLLRLATLIGAKS